VHEICEYEAEPRFDKEAVAIRLENALDVLAKLCLRTKPSMGEPHGSLVEPKLIPL